MYVTTWRAHQKRPEDLWGQGTLKNPIVEHFHLERLGLGQGVTCVQPESVKVMIPTLDSLVKFLLKP